MPFGGTIPASRPGTSVFSTSKRSACDRCRHQKLRCLRDEPAWSSSTSPASCTRCRRAAVPCVTNFVSPPPPMRTAPAPLADPWSSSVDLALVAPGGGGPPPPADGAAMMIVDGRLYHQAGLRQRQAQQHGPLDHAATVFPDSLVLDRYGDGLDAQTPGTGPRSTDYSEDVYVCAAPSSTLFDAADGAQSSSSSPSPASSSNSELARDLRLARLGLDLCRQMQQCIASANSSANSSSSSSSGRSSMTELGKANDPPFSAALHSTAEFISILRSLPPLPAKGNSLTRGEARAAASHSYCYEYYRPPNDATVLNLVSTYLRLVALFDKLFLQLVGEKSGTGASAGWTTAGNGTSTCNSSPLPGLHLSGFPVPDGEMQTKVLGVATRCQFQTIEALLGLPPELCLMGAGGGTDDEYDQRQREEDMSNEDEEEQEEDDDNNNNNNNGAVLDGMFWARRRLGDLVREAPAASLRETLCQVECSYR